jgi:hypothetical protein
MKTNQGWYRKYNSINNIRIHYHKSLIKDTTMNMNYNELYNGDCVEIQNNEWSIFCLEKP